MGSLRVARIYDPHTISDGKRILIDRLWPRGVSKEQAALDEWAKEITPTNELRENYHNAQIDKETFLKRYRHELENNEDLAAFLSKLEGYLRVENVTLVTAVKDLSNSHVPLLYDYLQRKIKLEKSAAIK